MQWTLLICNTNSTGQLGSEQSIVPAHIQNSGVPLSCVMHGEVCHAFKAGQKRFEPLVPLRISGCDLSPQLLRACT